MSVFWLTPLAWTGLVLVAVPFVIHLLARQRSRRVLFPSLRFLPESQLPALRRHAVADWPLLLLRMLMIATAVAAAAAPVFVSKARRESWDARIARAIVLTDVNAEASALAQQEAKESVVSAQFSQPRLVDAVRAAADWLRDQPPAAREVVLIGDLRERSIARRDFAVLPPHVGIRFLPVVPEDGKSGTEVDAIADVGRGLSATRLQVEAGTSQTQVRYQSDIEAAAPRIRVLAEAARQAYADALLRAVLREGVVFERGVERAVTIAFAGAAAPAGNVTASASDGWVRDVLERNPDVRGGEANGELIVHAMMAVTDERAPQIVADILHRALSPDFDAIEPRRIAPATLARWSRPPTGSPADAVPDDEHDRRWFWGASLMLIVAEQLRRRRKRVV